MIPYKSIGNERGMLLGFKPDYIILNDDEKIFIDRKSVV